MGITLSTILKTGDSKSNSGYYQVPAERQRVHNEALAEATVEMIARELYALFPPTVGDTSYDQPKEGETERDEGIELRVSEFMIKGACKESFTALKDCVDEAKSHPKKCDEFFPRLNKCMHAHSDYYQPILALVKASEEMMKKELVAFVLSEMEAAERKRAKKIRGY